MSLNIAVLHGSARSERQGIKAAKFITNTVNERGDRAVLVDASKFNLPFLDKMYKEFPPGKAPENMEQLATILKSVDAFIIVSGEYNHGIPAVLKNMLDHFQKEYHFKPSGIACYSAGPFGGVRVAMHLRAVLCELGMSSIPSLFPISRVGNSFDEKGKALDEAYPKRIKRFLDELNWYANALKKARTEGTPY